MEVVCPFDERKATISYLPFPQQTLKNPNQVSDHYPEKTERGVGTFGPEAV